MKDRNRLERVQARATKLIPELRYLSYEEKLEMPTLKARRLKLDLVQAYKILHCMHGFDNINYKNCFTLNENYTRNNR